MFDDFSPLEVTEEQLELLRDGPYWCSSCSTSLADDELRVLAQLSGNELLCVAWTAHRQLAAAVIQVPEEDCIQS